MFLHVELTQKYNTVTIQQVSGSSHVQVVSFFQYTGQSDNTAAQQIYNNSNVNKNSTPRYMRAVRNHIQVYAMPDRSPPAMEPDCSIQHRAALMTHLMSPPSGLYQRHIILLYDMQRKAYNINNYFTLCLYFVPLILCRF